MKQRANAGHDGASDEEVDAKGIKDAAEAETKRRREDVWMRI